MLVKSWAQTDVGKQRSTNEDCYYIDPDNRLVLVLDGMGGHKAGEVASRLAMETISEFYKTHCQESPESQNIIDGFDQSFTFEANLLRQAALLANRIVLEKAKEGAQFGGMGCTLTGMAIHDFTVSMINVGDSRIYLIRNNTIEQISKDHTLAEDQVERGIMSCEEARESQLRHILSSVIGVDSKIRIHMDEMSVLPGDIFVLCTDGLTAVMSDEEILAEVSKGDLGQETLDGIVNQVNDRGGPDNVTLVVTVFGQDNGRSESKKESSS